MIWLALASSWEFEVWVFAKKLSYMLEPVINTTLLLQALFQPLVFLILCQADFLELLEFRGLGVGSGSQKNCCKSSLLHPNHLKLGATHLWALKKINIIHVIKMMMSALFSDNFCCLIFKFFLCLKSTSFRKSNDLNLC